MIKKIMILIAIIILIFAGVFIGKKIVEKEDATETSSNSIEEENKIEEENTVVENEVEEEKVEEEDKKEEEKTTAKDETPEEKAIRIVEENWGEDDSIHLDCEKEEDGRYKVTVTDKGSANILYWYHVDIESGTFDIEEGYHSGSRF